MSMHFGREHNMGKCDMEPTKDANGIKVKDLVYIVNLTCAEDKDQATFDSIVLYRKSQGNDKSVAAAAATSLAGNSLIDMSRSVVESADQQDRRNTFE